MKLNSIHPRRILAGALAAMLSVSIGFAAAPAAHAAEVSEATIHRDRQCSVTLFKYDFTNAAKDGVWTADSYVSTGQYDEKVNNILGNAIRKGASGNSSSLGNGESSNGYAIKGCEFTYRKVADVYQYSQPGTEGTAAAGVEVLYAFNKKQSSDFLTAIGLPDGAKSSESANALPGNEENWYYRSDILNQALEAALNDNATVVKNALEAFARDGGVAMPLTDFSGRSSVSGLEVGLYLFAETAVPEMVTNTTSPFLVSLPATNVNGGGDGTGSNDTEVTDGGHTWLYDLTLYPKNETGIPSLKKEVRESRDDGGKHNGTSNIHDGFSSNATGSTGDIMDFQIISSLPTITSDATKLSVYNFYDVISEGLTYNKEARDVLVEFFTDKECTNKVASWDQDSGNFTVSYSEDGRSMTVDMTPAGIAEINRGSANANGSLYVGYSNYTVRLTYTAILNENAATVVGDSANRNKVVLTWKRSSGTYYDTLIDDAHVYTYGLDLLKQFSDLDNNAAQDKDLFSHVKFKIYNASDKVWLTANLNEAEGIYYVSGYADEEHATVFVPTTVGKDHGHLLVHGLEDDEYILTELETADGYTLLKDNIKMEISIADDPTRPCGIYGEDELGVLQNDARYSFSGGLDLHLANIPQVQLAHNMISASASVDGNKTTMAAVDGSANALATMTVINSRGFDLPATGDNGTRLLPIAGAVFVAGSLVLGGCIYLMMRKKKNGEA